MTFATALLPSGWAQQVRVEFQHGVITAVTPDSAAEPGASPSGIGVPGIANLHSHAFQRGLAGLAEYRGGSDSFWTWREVMYRFLTRLTPDDVEAIAALAFAEMLEAGFTRVGEFHYLHHDPAGQPYANPAEMAERIAAAAVETGIGLTLLPVFYERGGFDGRPPNTAQRRFCSGLDLFADLVERCQRLAKSVDGGNAGVAPHSLRAVSEDSLKALTPLLAGRPVHIHIAEQRKEVADCLAATRTRPVRWLFDHIPVDANWCLIHATHTDKHEVQDIARSGAVTGLCPISEANLGDGLFAVSDYLADSGHFGIGTDSHIQLSLVDELRMLEYGQRLDHQSRNVIAGALVPSTGRTLFETALKGGAQALGVPAGIQVGAPADFVRIDGESSLFIGRAGDQLLDSLIFCGSNAQITDVWRGGHRVVSQGRHICKDAILARYRNTLGRFLAR